MAWGQTYFFRKRKNRCGRRYGRPIDYYIGRD